MSNFEELFYFEIKENKKLILIKIGYQKDN